MRNLPPIRSLLGVRNLPARRKLAGAALMLFLLLYGLGELVSVHGLGVERLITELCFLVLIGAAVVLIYRRNTLPPSHLIGYAGALAAASLISTLTALTEGFDAQPPALESGCLFVLALMLARRWTRYRDAAVLVLVIVAAMLAHPTLVGAVAGVVVLALGWALREADLSAERRLLDVRNEERQDIARDLHDDVAHHITGIVVAAQAAAFVAPTDATAAAAALNTIEHAGIEALESMRSLVSVLRAPGQGDGTGRNRARWPGDLSDLLQRFERTTGLGTSLTIEAPNIPTVYRQAMQRVTQEALTNVSRHAQNATRTDVVVREDEQGFHLTVTDDGRFGSTDRNRLAAAGGGFGLVGVNERATALGGRVHAAHHPPGGWRVELTLPVPEHSGPGHSSPGQAIG